MEHPRVRARIAPIIESGEAATCAIIDLEVLYSTRNHAEHAGTRARREFAYQRVVFDGRNLPAGDRGPGVARPEGPAPAADTGPDHRCRGRDGRHDGSPLRLGLRHHSKQSPTRTWSGSLAGAPYDLRGGGGVLQSADYVDCPTRTRSPVRQSAGRMQTPRQSHADASPQSSRSRPD